MTLVPSGCFWDATVWVSYEVSWGEPAFLWLLVNLSQTWTAGSDKPVVTVFLVFCPEVLPTVRCRSDPTGPEVGLVTYKIEDLLGSSSDFSKITSQPSSWRIFFFLSDLGYAGDKGGGLQLSPTCHLGTGGFNFLLHDHQFHLLVITVNSKTAADRPKSRALSWYAQPWTWNLRYFLDCSCIGIWK